MVKYFKRLSLVGAAAVMSSSAVAADLIEPVLVNDMPAPVIEHNSEVPASGGWYLRGDIGYKVYSKPKVNFRDKVSGNFNFYDEKLNNAAVIGAGVGYQFNDYFRSDVTVDYETLAKYTGHSACIGSSCKPGKGKATQGAKLDVWSVMLNGYVDLGTWNKITPYVGAGIGTSYVRVSDVYFQNPNAPIQKYDGSKGRWNFAWALMAGASYAVNSNWSVDAGYQFRDLGKAETVMIHDNGTGRTRAKFERLQAHEFRLGLRYKFDNYAAAPTYDAPSYGGPISSNF